MGRTRFTVLGWMVWQIATFLAKWRMGRYQTKVRAIGVIALVLIGGVLAAKHDSE